MKIANDERLSILKKYVRKHFRLTKNVRVLVLLISEEETRVLRDSIGKKIEKYPELQEYIKQHPPNLAKHEQVIILSTESSVITIKKNDVNTDALRRLTVKAKTKIHNFEKFRYAILVREELLEALGRKLCPTPEDHYANFAELAFCRLLCHEFLHIVQHETTTQIYNGTKRGNAYVTCVLNHLPQEYWEKVRAR